MSTTNVNLCIAYSSKDNKAENSYVENKNPLFESCAVKVSNLVYSYSSGKNRVLNNCNINVSKGEIYALLGSNGCGKTTLINCIIGLLRPQSGHITTFGVRSHLFPRNQIGYVPQHISLYSDFNIEENLRYFGRLYGLSDDSITIKIHDLLKLLDLPEKSRLVSKLSDGQKRRVSLCVALIHNPMLVILDEPTVGVDPMLRHQIWDYLQMICSKYSTTVIITTHYLEEARNASTVAYLRFGQILTEQNPELLLNKYNCNNLEDAFLKLCQNNTPDNMEGLFREALIEENVDNISLKKRNEMIFHFWPLFSKNFVLFYRSQRIASFLNIINSSVTLLLLYLFILNNEVRFPMSYYNDDTTSTFSTEFINLLNKQKFNYHSEDSEYSVINSVIDTKAKVGISFTRSFTKDMETILIDIGLNSLPTNISGINVYLESINVHDLNIIPELTKTYLSLIQNYLASNGLNPLTVEPIFQQIIIYGNSQSNVYEFSIASYIVLTIFYTSIIGSQNNLFEKIERVFERSIIAGVNSFSYYFAHLIVKIMILMVHVIIFMIIIYPIIEPRISNLFVLYVFLVVQGITGITLGFLLCCFISNATFGIAVLYFINVLMVCISGCFWPVEALPQIIQYIIPYIVPFTLPIKSLQGIMLRGWSIGHYDVWIGFVSSFIFSTIYFAFAVIYSHFYVFKS